MPRRAANLGRHDVVLEQRAFDLGKAKLEELAQTLVDADSDVKERLFSLVDGYKATCRGLAARRAQIIHETSAATPNAARLLEEDRHYLIAVPERTVFHESGVLIAYMPAEGEANPHPNHPGQSEEVSPPVHEDKGRPEVKHEGLDVHSRPPAWLPTDNKEDLTQNIEPPAPENAAPAAALPAKDPHRGRQAPLVYSSRQSPTLQPPINTSKVANYWLFDYSFKQQHYLFIMRCPAAGCQSAIFTHHPLKRNRAADHLRACGIPFRNERDMVQRYARQVITGRKGRVVRHSWAWMHNHKLLAADEMHLDEENLSAHR